MPRRKRPNRNDFKVGRKEVQPERIHYWERVRLTSKSIEKSLDKTMKTFRRARK